MQPLLLLHGAIGAHTQLNEIEQQLSEYYKVYKLDFSGHGGKPFSDQPFSIELFADEVLAALDKDGLEKVSIFGYSMGGYVAMMLAKKHPDRIDKIATLATKFYWDEPTAEKELKMLNANKIEEKLPGFAKTLKERHAPNNWKEVLQHTKEMLLVMGKDNPLKLTDYEHIEIPSLIMLGDRDKMITMQETVDVYNIMPNAQMAMLPKTPHPIEQVNLKALLFHLKQFIG